MLLKQQTKLIEFNKGQGIYRFLPNGDIFEFINCDCMINGFIGNARDGSANNIYLRKYENGKVVEFAPLLGISSGCSLSKSADKLVYSGVALGIEYKVIFAPSAADIWFFKVALPKTDAAIDLVYAQDIGVASQGGVLTNELYMSQYLDHKILEDDSGYVVCSRQNQSQNGNFPYLQQGAIGTKVVAYSTDATQFFGRSYKKSGVPQALSGDMENRNYQFELSYIALQTEQITLDNSIEITFYGLFKNSYETAVTDLKFTNELKKAYDSIDWNCCNCLPTNSEAEISKEWGKDFASPAMSYDEVATLFPNRRLEEFDDDGELMSFFTDDYTHIVLQQKEVKTERPHGHIITTLLSDTEVSYGLISSTNYMYGIFNGQVVLGNTSFHKLISAPRGLLNILKNTGQRIYVKQESEYRLLTMPALYELGVNYAKWYYKTHDGMIIVTVYTTANSSNLVLNIKSSSQIDIVVTNQLVMGEVEFKNDIEMVQTGNRLTIKPLESNWKNSPYKGLNFCMHIKNDNVLVSDDRIFFTDNQTRNGTLLTLKANMTDDFTLTITGSESGDIAQTADSYSFEDQRQQYLQAYTSLNRGFKLSINSEKSEEIDRLNAAALWYTHNAMVHFAVPHGLEQPGGAAWGTRDVCQGPMEYFLSTQHYSLARNVITHIFSHQSILTGEWPQWFMFDKYNVYSDGCHGDVVFWPMKCVCDYITATNDMSILSETAGFYDMSASDEKQPIIEHIRLAMKTVKARFLHNTALISYAGGDWDDTLQPANKELADYLVSAWTMALAYQVILGIGTAVLEAEIDDGFGKEMQEIAERIRGDFNKYLIKDKVIAGFAYCQHMDKIRFMLHPDDNDTMINYRLLPLTRSIISEMVSAEQSKDNIKLILEHLKCPDGVRLMDKPARYEGGVCRYFQRAEQAANVGREISLQYVHAHIRFIESMAKVGNAEEVWNGLMVINSVNIKKSVPNARLRQANTYFSSSEGAFDTRYEYQNNFDMLRSGAIEVKGGWRIYSSGPGIYINQLVSNVLGVRFCGKCVEFDPVLPPELDGMIFDYACADGDSVKEIRIIYHLQENNNGVTRITVNGNDAAFTVKENPYRHGAAQILKSVLTQQKNVIEIFMHSN